VAEASRNTLAGSRFLSGSRLHNSSARAAPSVSPTVSERSASRQPGLENQRRYSAGGGAGHVAQHVKEAARAAGVVNLKHFHAGGKAQGN
jgi:hypothetical protein